MIVTSVGLNPNFPSETFWDHEILHEDNSRYFRTRIFNDQSTLFDMKIPSLTSSEQIYEYIDDMYGKILIEDFADKLRTDRVLFPFCQADLKTAIFGFYK